MITLTHSLHIILLTVLRSLCRGRDGTMQATAHYSTTGWLRPRYDRQVSHGKNYSILTHNENLRACDIL